MKLPIRHRAWLLVSLVFALPLYAQSSLQQEFDRKRQLMLDEFEAFRKEANREYLSFLSQAWIEMGIEPELKKEFKPIVEPVSPPKLAELALRLESGRIETIDRIEGSSASSTQQEIAQIKEPAAVAGPSISLRFYGAALQYTYSGVSAIVPHPVRDERTAIKMWKMFADAPLDGLLKQLLETKRQLALNDWAFYLLTEEISHKLFSERYHGIATVFHHFLLVQFGYDARIAKQKDEIVMLVPFKQKVFARSFVKVNEASYYIYPKHPSTETSLLTYQIPTDKVQGDLLSLVYTTPLNFPADRIKKCRVGEHTECPVEVKLNSNLIDFYHHYPQMEVKNYAAVAVDPTFTVSLLQTFTDHLKGKTRMEQLAILLKWTQHSFEYLRDEVQFGREKPFFIEENFFYPGNDCEDRAILLSYLAWHLLQVDVVLVEYEGHVATAIAIEGEGDYFLLQGKKFLVCDPTYIHASIGQSMPKYKKEKATILFVSNLWKTSKS